MVQKLLLNLALFSIVARSWFGKNMFKYSTESFIKYTSDQSSCISLISNRSSLSKETDYKGIHSKPV